ncbi:MAG: hypothetical protein MUF18_08745 [Fimbriiglobus sp.]|jgi:cytochrome c556|nr:hypothetical protein [Fimbriiglobus sp.]
MRNATRVGLLLVLGLLTAGVGGADKPADKPKDDPKPPTRKELMDAKLKHTQTVLEGIAVNDFDKIVTAADELVRMSRANDFLNAYKGEEYTFQVNTFRRAAAAVSDKAKAKNMDGVMVAYNELTLTCLKCHQAMRDKKFDARLPLPDAPKRGE